LSASAAHAVWSGSLSWARGCGAPGACLVHFNLSTNEVALRQISEWLSPRQKPRPWYQMLTSVPKSGPSFIGSLQASGKISLSRLLLRDLIATHVSANVNLEDGKLRLSDLRGDFLDGKHRGDWQLDFTANPPIYAGSGTLTGISLGRLADPMKDDWIKGTADGTYQLKAAGSSSADFWQSAQATVEFRVRDGILPHIFLMGDNEPLRVASFDGQALLHDGALEVTDGRLNCADGIFRVSGTASFSRDLDLKLAQTSEAGSAHAASHGYTITGTVEEPRVAPIVPAETHASLKQQ
jgi:uncharacterized protein involved in outer membrane biogenesis